MATSQSMTRSRRRQNNRQQPLVRLRNPTSGGRETPPTRWWMHRWAICAFLAVLTAAVYSPVRTHPFIDYDDVGYVTQNLHVQDGLSWDTLRWSLTATEQTNWHPLTWLSHALDCQLFGLNAGAHHITSLVIHVINVVLLFLLLETVTGAAGRSFLVAALFALHPFNVDSVAWIAERKNVVSTLFFLLTLGAYGWYARKPEWKRYAWVAGFFVLGLMAKPMLVTLPFVLLLLDCWPLQRIAGWSKGSEQFPVPQASMWRLVTEKLPLFALSLASCVVTVIAQQKAIQPAELVPYIDRLQNAAASYALYIGKAIWPSGFAVYYPYLFDATLATKPGLLEWSAVIIGVFLLTAGSWLAWRQRRQRPYLATGWAWYVGSLVPVIGIVQVGTQGMADRYTYVPLIGIFVIAAWGLAEIADHFQIRAVWREAVVAAVLVSLSLLSVRELRYWRSDYDLWTHALQVTKNSYFANDQVGNMLAAAHQPDALQYFEEAARIAPRDPTSHEALAASLQDKGQLREAIQDYEVVVHGTLESSHLVFSYTNLTVIFGELGDYRRAREAFARAVGEDSQATSGVISGLARQVSAHPADEGYLRLGLLLEQAGEIAQARVAYENALKLNPNRLEAQKALEHLELTTQAASNTQ